LVFAFGRDSWSSFTHEKNGEEYSTRSLPRFGVRKARLIFWIQAIHASLIFLARPLAGIAGLAWIGKIIDALLSKLLK